jgi:hypothetical protein
MCDIEMVVLNTDICNPELYTLIKQPNRKQSEGAEMPKYKGKLEFNIVFTWTMISLK